MSDLEKQRSSDEGAVLSSNNTLGKFFFILDWAVVIALLIMALLIDSYAPVFQREFVLADYTISYNQRPDTITYTTAGCISIIIPFGMIILCSIFTPKGKRFTEVYRGIHGLAQSVIITLLMTNIFKVAVGELRPYFLAVCLPDLNNNCTGDPAAITEARKSFLSGHTSTAFSGLFYLSLIYIRAFKFRFSNVLNYTPLKKAELNSNYYTRYFTFVLIVTPTFGACLIGLSRISDYHHNPHDVIFGAILGIIMALSAFRIQFPSFYIPVDAEKEN